SDVAHNKKSLIGTNVYADLSAPLIKEEGPLHIPYRLAEPYENLRAYFEKDQPKVVLLTFGELKDFKPRADFVKGYLATGGIDVEYSPAFEAVKEGKDWIKTAEFDYGVICVSRKDTEKVLNKLINDLPKDKIIDVAGKYNQENEKKKIDIDKKYKQKKAKKRQN